MEVGMSPPVKEGSVMENDKGDGSVKLTKSQRRRMSLIARVKYLEARNAMLEEELASASGVSKTPTVDKKRSVSSSVATTDDEKSSISGVGIEKGNGAVKLTRSQKKKLKVSVESLDKRKDTESTKRKAEVSSNTSSPSPLQNNDIPYSGNGSYILSRSQTKNLKDNFESLDEREDTKSKAEVSFHTISLSPLQTSDNPYSGIGTAATVDQNNRVSSSSAGDGKRSVSKIEAPSDEMGSSMIKNLNVEVKTENKMETAVGENATDNTAPKKSKRPKKKKKDNPESGDFLSIYENTQDKAVTVDQNNRVSSSSAIGDEKSSVKNLNVEVKTQNKMETAVGETGSGTIATDSTASKKSKRLKKKKNNPESGDVLSTRENTVDKTVTVDQNNRVSSSSATGDEKSLLSKIEGPSGEMGSNTITNLNVEVKTQNKMETLVGETGSGTNETDNTVTKKSKRPKKKKYNPESGDVLSTCENTQDKTVTVDHNNRVPSSSAVGDKKSSISKREDPGGEMGSNTITNLNVEVKIQNKMETAVGETGLGTNATDDTASKKRKRQKGKNKNPESGDVLSSHENTPDKTATPDANMVSKGEENTEVANGNMGSSANTYINVVRVANDDKASRKSSETTHELGKRKWKDSETEKLASSAYLSTSESTITAKKDWSTAKVGEAMNGAGMKKWTKSKRPTLGEILSTRKNTQDKTATVDQNNRVSSSSANGDEKCSISKIEASSGKTGSSMVTSLNAEVKTQNKMETAVGETGSGTSATENSASKTSKRLKKKKKNPESVDILSTHENTEDKTATDDQNNRVSSSSARGDEKSSISKIEASSGKTGSSMITSLYAEVKSQNKMETAVGETGSGTNATDNPASNTSKRPKKKKKNPESGDVLSSHENTLDKTAIPDANMVSKGEDNTKVANGNMSSSANTNINVNDTINTDTKPKSKDKSSTLDEISDPGHVQVVNDDNGSHKNMEATHELGKRKWKELETEKLSADAYINTSESTIIAKKDWSIAKVGEVMNGAGMKKWTKSKRPTLGEILNPWYLEALEADMENNKRPRLDMNLTSNGVLSTGERMQNTHKHFVALSTELEREDHPKTANGEKGPSTIVDGESTMLRGIPCTEVANIAEPAELEITEAKANTTLPIKMVKQNTEVQEKTQVTSLGKKLVILDVNGLLADFVSPVPMDIIADYHISRRAVFKRPFLDDFLSFCFERFHVGIWSSRTMRNLEPVVNFLLRDRKKKLLFLWDASQCTNSGLRTLEERNKFLVLKDLQKIWETDGPYKSWVKGTFNESNTLLLDDSPYKALVNPKHSGIFPVSYSYKNRDDNFLAPKGELQNYLEGLAASDNVKTYVEQHPFGQGVIDETHPDWPFYSRVTRANLRDRC